jgi:hypothetical protein
LYVFGQTLKLGSSGHGIMEHLVLIDA